MLKKEDIRANNQPPIYIEKIKIGARIILEKILNFNSLDKKINTM